MIFSRANLGTFATCVAILGCGFVTGVLTARILGPVARGELATVMLWPIVFSNLGLLGCNWALAREVAGDPKREADYACDAMAVGLTSGLICFLLGFVLIPFLLPADKRDLVSLARLCLLFVPVDILNQFLLAIEHGRMRWRRFNFVRASYYLLYVGLICLVWRSHKIQVIWFVWAFLASQTLTLCLRLWIQRESFAAGRMHLDGCRRLVRSGRPFFLTTATNLVTLQLDKILVVALLSVDAAGIYAVASACSAALTPFGDALGITSFAILSNETSSGNRKKILTETFRQSALVSCCLGGLIAVLIPFLVQPVFGPEFSPAARPAMILAFAASLTTSSDILNEGLRGAGRPYAGLASQLTGGGVMAVAAILLLGRHGLIGMAWAVLLSSCAQVAVLVIAAANWLRISPVHFWPFGAKDVRLFFQQAAALRFRILRSLA